MAGERDSLARARIRARPRARLSSRSACSPEGRRRSSSAPGFEQDSPHDGELVGAEAMIEGPGWRSGIEQQVDFLDDLPDASGAKKLSAKVVAPTAPADAEARWAGDVQGSTGGWSPGPRADKRSA